MLFISVVFAALALRLCVAACYDRLRAEIFLGENTRWIDRVLLAATGAVGGLALTIGMASLLSGSSGGLMLDLGIGLTASAVIILMAVHDAPCPSQQSTAGPIRSLMRFSRQRLRRRPALPKAS